MSAGYALVVGLAAGMTLGAVLVMLASPALRAFITRGKSDPPE